METYNKLYSYEGCYIPDGVMAEQCPRKTKRGDIAMFKKYVKYSEGKLIKTTSTLTYINKDYPSYKFGECEIKNGYRNTIRCLYFLNSRAISPDEDIKAVLKEAGFIR